MDPYEEYEYTEGFQFSLWKKLIKAAFRHKKALLGLAVSTLFMTLFDSMPPLFTRYAIDNFIGNGDLSGLPWFIALNLGCVAGSAVFVFGFIHFAGKIEVGVVKDIRQMGFKKLQELSFSYYDTTHVGWIMARMTTDAQKIGEVLSWGCLDLMWGLLMVAIASVIMFVLNFRLALIVFAVMPVLLATSYFFQKRILARFRESRKINSKITAAYNEGINGAKTSKTLIREEQNFADFKVLTMSMKRASLRAILLTSLHFPVIMALSSLGLGSVIWAGGNDVIRGLNGVTLGVFSAFLSYTFNMMDPIMQIAAILSEIQAAQASAERAMTLLETETEIKDRPDVIEKYGDFMNPRAENWPAIEGAIEFKDVSFSYKTGEKVLENFNLKIAPGEKIALVGETGSGKSTIVNLVCRFYEPTSGRLLIDGVDYRARSQIWLQSSLGYVLQSPHLFSGTIMENIRYSKLEASDEEVIEAAKLSGAYDFIQKFDKGFNTDVGEGGNRLSAGEKQLVSFARAILGKSKIFVLDEATSSIDTETEQKLQRAIDKVLAGKTSFIVAHRLSTIRSCDRILVIDNGEIVENGNHRELLRLGGRYHDLYMNQFKEEAGAMALAAAN